MLQSKLNHCYCDQKKLTAEQKNKQINLIIFGIR